MSACRLQVLALPSSVTLNIPQSLFVCTLCGSVFDWLRFWLFLIFSTHVPRRLFSPMTLLFFPQITTSWLYHDLALVKVFQIFIPAHFLCLEHHLLGQRCSQAAWLIPPAERCSFKKKIDVTHSTCQWSWCCYCWVCFNSELTLLCFDIWAQVFHSLKQITSSISVRLVGFYFTSLI